MRVRSVLVRLIVGLVLIAAVLLAAAHMRRHPEDLPWTPLDLAQPIGLFTGRKLAALAGEPAQCAALLGRAGVRHAVLDGRRDGPSCGYEEAIRLRSGGSREIAYRPDGLGVRCPVAAALALWEWHVVQPAAAEHLGSRVVAIDHFGSYACRRIGGAEGRSWSEHATANAVDIAAFRLADGRRVSIVGDWDDPGAKGRFLRTARDGACDLFATVLTPDYNQAHRDHFHLDQADRGMAGWRACR